MTTRTQKSGSEETFVTTFVAAKKGMQTGIRIGGRRAFPSRGRPFPKLGETWLVSIAGENPAKSVYFVNCIELVAAAVKEPKAVDHAANFTNVAIAEKQLTADAAGVQTSVIANDHTTALLQRVESWLVKPKEITFGNLLTGYLQGAVDGDAQASELRETLKSTMSTFDLVCAEGKRLAQLMTKRYMVVDYELADRLYSARKEMECRKLEARELQLQTLAYARSVRLVKAQGVGVDKKLVAEAADLQLALDQARAKHKEKMTRTKVALEELELEYLYLDFDQRMLAKGAGMSKFETPEADREFVDQILILLDAEAGCEAQKVELLARLEVEVNALEERVQMIVKK
ncbi:MAG: hypothetical protein IPJ49_20555 [Candidatus Obscuribacter sp.]|nr:hypothetical protein [Candidatus Obscuribacter sp.]